MNRKASEILDWIFIVVGLGMFLYHMISSQYLLFGSYEHQDIHLGFLLVLVFLQAMRKSQRGWVWARQVVLIALSVVAVWYVFANMTHLEEVIGYPEGMDLVIGVILILLVIEGTRQAWGAVLPIVAVFFIAYFVLGHLIPGALHHRPMTLQYVISYLSIGLSGIYGQFLSISSNEVFLFVVCGALLEVAKINDFYYEVGKLAGRLLRGGPAQTSVASSALVGMVTGAAVANVAITGSYTIPFMKGVGYTPEDAGAIEATAATGGQIMPPVMGASAFLMAMFLGVPYATIMMAGIIPALLYYFGVAIGVQQIALSRGINPPKEAVNKGVIYGRLPFFIIPLGIIVVLLLLRYSPMHAAFWAILASVALSYTKKELRPSPLELARSLARGAYVGAQIGVSLAIVGMIAQTLITTGLGNKIVSVVELISGGSLVITLIVTMLVSLQLGMGVPTIADYSLIAIIVVPSMIRMGTLDIAAHFFAFYFAIIAALTPPVALASLAATGIAGGNYWKTGWNAVKLATPGFIIPFIIVYNPILVLRPDDMVRGVVSLLTIPIGLTGLTWCLYNCGLVQFTNVERWLALLSAVGILGYALLRPMESLPNIQYLMLVMGLVVFALVLRSQYRKKRKERL